MSGVPPDAGEPGVSGDRGPLFGALVYAGGLVFGLGLAVSGMTRPEVVLDFLQFEDLGLLFVMGGAAAVTGVTFAVASASGARAPLTGRAYGRRLRTLDRNVLLGGAAFGAGWGISGICPGAAYASLGTGNVPILWALAGMVLGAYVQGRVRSTDATVDATPTTAD